MVDLMHITKTPEQVQYYCLGCWLTVTFAGLAAEYPAILKLYP